MTDRLFPAKIYSFPAVLCFLFTITLSPAQNAQELAPPPEAKQFDIDQLTNMQIAKKNIGSLSEKEVKKRGFSLLTHEALSRGQVGRVCSNVLASAQWNQDVWHFLESKAHFDNCAFKPGLAYIQELLQSVDNKVLLKDRDGALKALGQVLHAIQDFYAHSNYVERSTEQEINFSKATQLRLWDPESKVDGKISLDQGFVSGTWPSFPRLCPPNSKTHGELAKDSSTTSSGKAYIPNWKMSGFEAAYKLADHASFEFLKWAYAKWPYLEESCGPIIAYGLLIDRRK